MKMLKLWKALCEGTLLHYATWKGNLLCIRVLLMLGANINARDKIGYTPLHLAARYGTDPDIVDVLINEGAIVDARDNYHRTPFHHTAARRDTCIEIAQKLIARGASLEALTIYGKNALHMAIIRSHYEMVKVLISYKINIDAKEIFGNTPLLLFFKLGKPNSEITQLLLDNGADVNWKSPNAGSSLFYAAKFNYLDSLYVLLKRGARVNEATDKGYTALHMACWKGLPDVTALLLKFGADLNARTSRTGKTPFEVLHQISNNRPSTQATARVIIREVVKRAALGQSICEKYREIIQYCEKCSKFDNKCREEVKRMRSEKIDIEDGAISIFYIFSIDEEKLTALARNEQIVTAFESSGYVKSFRIYAGELTTKFEVAKKRANFLMKVEDCLGDVLGDVLPILVVRKIASYLNSTAI